MVDRYTQYRILYCLYVNLYNSGSNQYNANKLLNDEDLAFIDSALIYAEISYLQDHELLKLEKNPYYTNLKITAKGIDIVNTILQKYYEYLKGSPERDLQGSYDNISAIPDLFGKRKTTHFYIKKRAEKFKKFIVSFNIFEELLSPGITQIHNQIDKSIHIEYVKNLSLMPIEERIRRLEDNYMERKPCFKYDISIKGSNRDREKQISKSIAGFLNTNGGILFIGIDNNGNVLGLRNDYSIVKNNNADGFELELRNSVDSFLKKKIVNELLEVKFPSVKSEEICEITIRLSSEPIVLNDNGVEEFYVREGNSTKPYKLTHVIEYCKKRFQSSDF